MTENHLEQLAPASRSWAIAEAQKVVERIKKFPPKNGYVMFETGYGPSGLPHIGTYCEVIRTKMVQNALALLSDVPSKLIVVSDDMDGMRKIPDNVPNAKMLEPFMQMPLTSVPDPFEKCESYGHYMNSRLREFLDEFGFEYEFKSATDLYKSGALDEYLLKALRKYDAIMDVMLPSLGEERQKTYSPFLPICPETKKVLYVPVVERDVDAGTITYIDERTNKPVTLPVTGGSCKLQWKPDFGVRWAALGVDFEMYGKDHQPNGQIYSRICEIVGGHAPEQFVYEMFLDEEGKKISKSKGNGVSIDQWRKYAPIESLAYFMYQSPRKAKKLYFSVIPKSVDEYLTFANKFYTNTDQEKLENPAAYVHNFSVPKYDLQDFTYSLLLNIASACNPTDKTVLLGFVKKHAPDVDCGDGSFMSKLSEYAMNYYEDFISPNKKYGTPTEAEKAALQTLMSKLKAIQSTRSAEEIQTIFYDVAKEVGGDMRAFFSRLYELLLGQKEGPRWGSFVSLYGIDKTIVLIENCLSR